MRTLIALQGYKTYLCCAAAAIIVGLGLADVLSEEAVDRLLELDMMLGGAAIAAKINRLRSSQASRIASLSLVLFLAVAKK